VRPYVKRRSKWVEAVMSKYFPDWPEYDEQVPLYDTRGLDEKTVKTVGIAIFTRMMPRADVIAVRDGELLLIEFDKQLDLMKVSRLLRYAEAMKHDYVRPEWHKARIKMVYVTPGYDARIEAECKRLGIEYIVEPEPRV
jgi:hypothetical protein